MPAAGFDEVSDLLSRFSVDDAAEPWWTTAGRPNHPAIVYDHPNLNASNPGVTGNHLLRVISLKLVEPTAVQKAIEQVTNVVRLTMVLRQNLVQVCRRPRRVLRRCD